MRFLSRVLYSAIPCSQSILVKSITNCFCSSNILLKKNDPSTGPDLKNSVVLDFPRKPKKPATSFIRFVMAMKPTILKDNPTLPKRDVIKYAAELWSNVDVETRVQFQIDYYTDLEKYYDEVQSYNASLTEDQSVALKKFEMRKKENRLRRKIKVKLKEFEKPKRPMNAFTLFLVSKKDQLKKINAEVYCHKVAKEWNELPENEKNKFRRISKKSQEEYYKKLEEWKERVGPLNIMHILKTKNFEEAKEFLNETPVVDPPISLEEDEQL